MVLHVVGGSHGTLGLSVITRPDATGWTPWSSLPKLPEPISQLDSALVTEELHVCVITATSRRLLHTFRDATGSWQPLWGDVGDAAGLTASDYELNDVAIAAAGGQLHVFTTALRKSHPGPIQPAFVIPVYHAVRSVGAAAAWTMPFRELNSGQFPGSSTVFGQLTADDVAGQLQLSARGYWGNEIWHTIQFGQPPTETWQPFNDAKRALTNSPTGVSIPALCGVGTNMHMCVLTDGSIYHTIRMSHPPSWQNPEGSGAAAWGDVVGSTVGITAGSVAAIDCAGVDGNLHICCATSDGHLHHTIRTSGSSARWENPEGSGSPIWGSLAGPGSPPQPINLVTATGR